jgi:hypothetical protein
MDVWRIHQGVILSLSEISMKRFDEFLDLLLILTPVIVTPIIFMCIAIAWFSSH